MNPAFLNVRKADLGPFYFSGHDAAGWLPLWKVQFVRFEVFKAVTM
jgi:hypothetical protein